MTVPTETFSSPVSSTVARSWLLVSAARPDLFDHAAATSADAIVLDLEDAVPAPGKPAARGHVARWLHRGGRAWVRINAASTPDWIEDCRLLQTMPEVAGVVLAKTESADHIERTAEFLGPQCPVVALVESALGLEQAGAIAAHPATVRLAFGVGDFRRDTGIGDEPIALAYARSRLVIASRAASIAGPIDGPTLDTQPPALAQDCTLTVSMGMTGKLTLRPEQVGSINAMLGPSVADRRWAQSVIEELGEGGERVGDGSDLPRLARAQRIRDLAGALRCPDLP
ncbi:HpcH/HpaI aldolase/citrate lyase family protein [Rhodococcus zopfii]|uniref:HpcH/HpaI aldolase/citrate lyase family protein n=1 Tax=Rhodococcus zopfii TaxID=43772 RepID=UPI000932FF0E|nr:CoA ester lyase [Rhodococcus zopfii]